jgi:signal transduction histidine kinase
VITNCGNGRTRWERVTEQMTSWTPYVTLAISTLALLFVSEDPWPERLVTLGLAGVAFTWVLFAFTLAPRARQERVLPMAIYFTGFLALATVLTALEIYFFIFTITGFMHAFLLRRIPLVFLAIFGTSVSINIVTAGFPPVTLGTVALYGSIITIQTFAIGLGTIGSERLTRLAEERRQNVAKLEAALEENAGLHAQLMTQAREAGVLDERQRMAREIHDTIAQGLTGIITQLEAAEHVKRDPEEWQRHLDNALRLARDSLSEARRSVQAVRPQHLESARLQDAIGSVAKQWSVINGTPVEVTTTGDARPMHPEVEVTLLRTAQEGLANVAKHAKASRVGLTLSYMSDVVTLDVRDDGAGFDPATVNGSGVGLTAMRQRVQRLAGKLEVESEPGAGTAISARVPALPQEVGEA